MSQPFVGEIRMFAGNFAPQGWAFCDGQLLAVSENDALFALIGTTYGGDGQTTFALPDLRGRIPVHRGDGVSLGQKTGTEEVTLTTAQVPAHTHAFVAADAAGNASSPAGNLAAHSFNIAPYIADSPTGSMNAAAIAPYGVSGPHANVQPFQCVHFIISLFGIFPSRN